MFNAKYDETPEFLRASFVMDYFYYKNPTVNDIAHLIKRGFDFTKYNTVFHYGFNTEISEKVMELLLENRFDPLSVDNYGNTIFHKKFIPGVFSRLVKEGKIELTIKNENEQTVFHKYPFYLNYIDEYVNVNARDYLGNTILHYIKHYDFKYYPKKTFLFIKKVLELGFDINVKNIFKNIPKYEINDVLLECLKYGLNPNGLTDTSIEFLIDATNYGLIKND